MTGRRFAALVDAPAFVLEPHDDPSFALELERDVAGWPRLPPEIARRFRLRPAAHFVARATATGKRVGAVSVVVHHDAGAGPVGWVGGLVVRPEARAQGLARRLLREAMAFAEKQGARTLGLDASPEGVALYEAEGFRAVARTHRWSRPSEPAAPRPVPARLETASVYPISSCEIMELHAYDAPRFGAGRSAWLAEVIAAHPERAFVAFDKKAGHVVGYALGQERFVGPLVADTPEIAARLLFACERAGTPPLVYPLTPLETAAGASTVERMLEAAGYRPDPIPECLRMVRGGDALPGRPETQFAIAAGALG